EFIKAINAVSKGEKYFSTPVSNILATGYLNRIKKDGTVSSMDERDDDNSVLQKREKGILRLIVKGSNNKDIAEALDISIRTIETHRFNIMKKLKVKNAVELVRKAIDE